MNTKFMKNVVQKKREAEPGEMMTISKRVYQTRIGRAYQIGAVYSLLKIGKSIPEIAEILELHESTVKKISEENV